MTTEIRFFSLKSKKEKGTEKRSERFFNVKTTTTTTTTTTSGQKSFVHVVVAASGRLCNIIGCVQLGLKPGD